MNDFVESYVEIHRGITIYCVKLANGAVEYFKTAGAANQAFPGSFDVPDEE